MQLAPVPLKQPIRIDTDSYEIGISQHGTRVVAVDKRTRKRTAISVSEKTRITSATAGDNAAACTIRGPSISQLILYNGKAGKWATISLPQCERPLRAEINVGSNVVCYRLNDRIIAYSVTKDMWGMLAVKVAPAVGDDSVIVTTADTMSEFTAVTGTWATMTTASQATR